MKKSLWILGAILALTALVLTGCKGAMSTSSQMEQSEKYTAPVAKTSSFPAGSTMERLNKQGTITVGTKFDQPLMGQKGPDGKPVGFDTDIAKIIAGGLGIEEKNIKWIETASANREPFIQNETVDIVVATYTINDKRKKVVDFAGPYYNSGQNLMIRNSTKDIKGPEDVRGKKVCSVAGSTPAATIVKEYGAELVPVQKYSDCMEPLRNEQVDAITTDQIILAAMVLGNEDMFHLVDKDKNFTEEPYGVGLKKGDKEFRRFINDQLQDAMDNGQWKKAWETSAGEVLPVPPQPKIDRYKESS